MKNLMFILLALLMVSLSLAADEIPQTPKPVITVEDFDTYLLVTATGEGTVLMYFNGSKVSNPNYLQVKEVDQVITVTATAQAENCLISEVADTTLYVPSKPKSPTPEVFFEVTDEAGVFSATGEGELMLIVYGEPVSNPFIVPRGEEDVEYLVTAAAKVEGCLWTYAETYLYVVPALPPTPSPEIVIEEHNTYVIISAVGEGDVSMYIDGVEVDNPCQWPRTESEQVITVSATAKSLNHPISECTVYYYSVLPLLMTPEPIITYQVFDDVCIITAYGEGEVKLYVYDNEVPNPYTIQRGPEDVEYIVYATAQYEDYQLASTYPEVFVVPAMMETTPAPEIIVEELDDWFVVSAVGEGSVYLYIDNEEVDNPYYAPRMDDDYVISAMAVAQNEGCFMSEEVYSDIVVTAHHIPAPSEVTIAPDVSYEVIDPEQCLAQVTVTPTEEGSTLYYRFVFFDLDDEMFNGWDAVEWDAVEWSVYTEPLFFQGPGRFMVQAYASVVGKVDSYISMVFFTIFPYNPEPDYDFEVNGIYYKITGENTVSVTENGSETNEYSGDIVIPTTVTNNSVTYMVTAIGNNAFMNCYDLTSVSIGDYVTEIGSKAFMSCTGLTEVVLGDYVISLDDMAFYDCTNLATVTFGKGLHEIGSNAFAGCTSLSTIICKPAIPPTIANQNCFECYDTAVLKVFPAVLGRYQKATYWKLFTDIVGEATVSPSVNDVDGDGKFSITDVTTLIERLLNGY